MESTTSQPKPPPSMKAQAFWLTLSKLIAALMNIGLPMLLVRVLTQAEYGAYKQAFLFTLTAANAANLGMGVSALYYMPRHPERGGQVALNILVYNFVAGLLVLLALLIYPQGVSRLFPGSALDSLAGWLGVMVILTLTSGLVQLMPTALQDVRNSTLFIIGTQLVKTLLLALAVLAYRSVKSLIAAAIIGQAISLFILLRYLSRRFPYFWTQFDWKFFKEQLSYALPIGAAGTLWVVQRDLDNYFVSYQLGPRHYAIYAIGWLDVPLISLFLESIAAVMVVRVSALQHQGRIEDIRRLMASATNRLAAVQFPLCALLLVAGHDLIVFFYTRAYEGSSRIFSISILLLALSAFLFDPVNRAFKELRKLVLVVNIIIMSLLLGLLTPTIHHFGMMGAAVLAVGAQYLQKFMIGWMVSRKLESKLNDLRLYSDLFKAAGLSVAAGLCARLVRNVIPANLLIIRILAVAATVGIVFLPAAIALHLPGWDLLTRENLTAQVRSALARFRGQPA